MSDDDLQRLLDEEGFEEDYSEEPGGLKAVSDIEFSSDEEEFEEDSEDSVIVLNGDEADLIESWHDLLDIRNFEEKSSPDSSGDEAAGSPENNDSDSDEAPLERIEAVPGVGAIQGSRPDLNYAWRPDYEPYYDGNPQGICGKHIYKKGVFQKVLRSKNVGFISAFQTRSRL